MALASAPPGHANRFVLLTDGRQNAGNAVAVAQAARDAGVDIHYVPAPLTFSQEVTVESMVLPQEVKFGEPFQAKVVAWSQSDAQGRLSLFRNGEFLGSQVVRLSAGKNVYTYRQSLEQSGIHVYQAAIEVDGDTIEENNRAVGTVVVRGRPQVLLADKDPAQAQSLASALRTQYIDVQVVAAESIPKDTAGFEKYDGVVLSNVSSLKLNKKQMESIREYVRDKGGGLVMVGGEDSFGLGGYYRTPVEEALPVTMEVKQKIEIPSLAVVLSIDRSGSMAMTTGGEKVTKLDIAKEAAHLVVDLLDERNEVGVMSWDTEFIWDATVRPARDKQAIHNAISTIKAGGGTDGYPALKESYQVLFERPALLKHVIFLSDGQMTRGDFQGLIRRMAKDKITVSTVAIGKDADVQLMFDVAKWGRGRFYYTEDDSTIPRIFTLETQLASKASLIEQPFRAALASPAHEAIQEIDWKSSPPLGGYVATTLKSTADLVLMTHQEDPLLATWRYGLGRSAAFTSDAKAKWALLWMRWNGFNKFWSQVVRWTLRSGTRSDTAATVARVDETGEVLVDAVDAKGEFINFLDSQVGVVSPNKQRTVVELEQVAPGRYRGRFPGLPGRRVPDRDGPAAGRADGGLAAGRSGGTVRAGVPRSRGGRGLPPGADRADRGGRPRPAAGRVPPGAAPVAARTRPVAVAGRRRRRDADPRDRAAAGGAGPAVASRWVVPPAAAGKEGRRHETRADPHPGNGGVIRRRGGDRRSGRRQAALGAHLAVRGARPRTRGTMDRRGRRPIADAGARPQPRAAPERPRAAPGAAGAGRLGRGGGPAGGQGTPG